MADDKKNIPETAPLIEAPAPAVENAAVPEPPAPEDLKAEKEQAQKMRELDKDGKDKSPIEMNKIGRNRLTMAGSTKRK